MLRPKKKIKKKKKRRKDRALHVQHRKEKSYLIKNKSKLTVDLNALPF